jgi:hypothetical protein
MFWNILALISDLFKFTTLAEYFAKKYEASVMVKKQAQAPLTNEEELKDIDNLPSA